MKFEVPKELPDAKLGEAYTHYFCKEIYAPVLGYLECNKPETAYSLTVYSTAYDRYIAGWVEGEGALSEAPQQWYWKLDKSGTFASSNLTEDEYILTLCMWDKTAEGYPYDAAPTICRPARLHVLSDIVTEKGKGPLTISAGWAPTFPSNTLAPAEDNEYYVSVASGGDSDSQRATVYAAEQLKPFDYSKNYPTQPWKNFKYSAVPINLRAYASGDAGSASASLSASIDGAKVLVDITGKSNGYSSWFSAHGPPQLLHFIITNAGTNAQAVDFTLSAGLSGPGYISCGLGTGGIRRVNEDGTAYEGPDSFGARIGSETGAGVPTATGRFIVPPGRYYGSCSLPQLPRIRDEEFISQDIHLQASAELKAGEAECKDSIDPFTFANVFDGKGGISPSVLYDESGEKYNVAQSDEYVKVELSCSDYVQPGCVRSGCAFEGTLYCLDIANSCTPSIRYREPVFDGVRGTSYVRFQSFDNEGNQQPVQSLKVMLARGTADAAQPGAAGASSAKGGICLIAYLVPAIGAGAACRKFRPSGKSC